MIQKGMMTSDSSEWSTPQALFDMLDMEFHFTLDPCCTHENAKCKKHYTMAENGLSQPWAGERVFMNPPYGYQIVDWLRKAYESALIAEVVVCLIPARTDTGWWHNYCMKGNIRFLRGRVSFVRADGFAGPAPFPSAIVIFRRKAK